MKKITIIDGVFHEEEIQENSVFDRPIIEKRISEIRGEGLISQIESQGITNFYSNLSIERLEEELSELTATNTYQESNQSFVQRMDEYIDSINLGNLRVENAIRQSREINNLLTVDSVREAVNEVLSENPFPNVVMGAGAQRSFDEAMRAELNRMSTTQEPYVERRVEIDPEITRYLTENRNENSNRRTRRNNRPSEPTSN